MILNRNKYLLGLLICLLSISCKNSIEQKIVGNWEVNGKHIGQIDTISDKGHSSYNLIYVFKSNGFLQTDFDANSSWKIENDSILIINTDERIQEYLIDIISDSKFVLTQMNNDIKYTYTFNKIME